MIAHSSLTDFWRRLVRSWQTDVVHTYTHTNRIIEPVAPKGGEKGGEMIRLLRGRTNK
jgi:hypothetical protein